VAIENISPWLRQIKRTRPTIALEENAHTTIAIVGGGISGVATAYFLLRDTNKSVTLLERDRVAHGATGHNGGQVVAAFETPLAEISKNFGCDLVSQGLKAINSAWDLLYSMIEETGIEVELLEVPAYLALSIGSARFMLEESQLRERLGLPRADILLAEDAAEDMPEELRSLFRGVPRELLDDVLLTRDGRYDCALVGKSGLMNSALFCEELVSEMIERYPCRFRVYENTPIQKIEIGKEALLRTPRHELQAQKVVLCTNGYTDLEIEGASGSLRCVIESVSGYMAGYLDERDLQPTATVYFAPEPSGRPGGYFYLSRRKYAEGSGRTLTSIGGPSQSLRKGECHSHEEVQDEHEYAKIDEFYRKTIFDVPGDKSRDFSWNGLMGYTSNGIRLIGPDPANSSLIYNLGCNGIGILPSIYGGKRIAQYINGEALEPSIFDPRSVRAQ
jgi:glycine/D-amino acid oxidase-like deaminating enzyme